MFQNLQPGQIFTNWSINHSSDGHGATYPLSPSVQSIFISKGVGLTLGCFVVYSTRRFVLCLTLCYSVLVFISPISIAITSLGEERANLRAFRTFVRFVLVWICRFSLPLGVREGLRFAIVALLGLKLMHYDSFRQTLLCNFFLLHQVIMRSIINNNRMQRDANMLFASLLGIYRNKICKISSNNHFLF